MIRVKNMLIIKFDQRVERSFFTRYALAGVLLCVFSSQCSQHKKKVTFKKPVSITISSVQRSEIVDVDLASVLEVGLLKMKRLQKRLSIYEDRLATLEKGMEELRTKEEKSGPKWWKGSE